MPDPKNNCAECGTVILQITADITGGFCMPCSNRKKHPTQGPLDWLSKKCGEPVDEVLQLEPDVIIHASFLPGLAEDLSSWETQVTLGGVLIQKIDWWRRGSSNPPEREIRTSEVSRDDIARLAALIQALDTDELKQLAKEVCIDDVELISFLIPSREFYEAISPYSAEYLDRNGQLSDAARSGLVSARALWDQIESISPYTTAQHWKG